MISTKHADITPGLSMSQARESLEKHGSNVIIRGKKIGFFHRFFLEFRDPIIRILLLALAMNIAITFRHPDWYESIGIAAAVFISTFVSTLSEHSGEKAFEKLRDEDNALTVRVIRESRIMELPSDKVVCGDVVLLCGGEKIPADGVLIEGELDIDQSALNGETKEKHKSAGREQEWSPDSSSMLFRGSTVAFGEGKMRVLRVGMQTMYGHMAKEIQCDAGQSPLKERLSKLASVLARIGFAAALLVFVCDIVTSLFIGGFYKGADTIAVIEQVFHAMTLGITVLVVAVPEGLPMMITVVLSRNMLRMQRDNVLVRKLVGIETAGSMNILFSDKTGTLTQGKMKAFVFVDADGNSINALSSVESSQKGLVCASFILNNSAKRSGNSFIGGNSTDRALAEFAQGNEKNLIGYECISRVPFDSIKKYSSATVRYAGKTMTLFKGAPEILLAHCNYRYDAQRNIIPFDNKSRINMIRHSLTNDAVRVIALTVREGTKDIFLGLVGLRDEIRREAKKTLAQIKGAGIRFVMVTGDNRETACAVAKRLGLINSNAGRGVITSSEMALLSDGELKEILPELCVVARALPSDKTRLVRVAKSAGMVVGMTGDGINDSPALKAADVGFAMGSGTDVAKEAGDIVIADDNIASIKKAVLYGRTIFKSIRKFIVFQLTMNICAVGVSAIAPFLGVDTPVTVIQMLWINIIMDTLAGLAFAGEAPLEEYMREAPKERGEPVLSRAMISGIAGMGIFTVFLCVLFLRSEFVLEMLDCKSNGIAHLCAFFGLFVFCGLFNSFNARTQRLNLFAHLSQNPAFIFIMLFVFVVQLLIMYFGGAVFRCTPIPFSELRRVIGMAFLVIPADLVRKIIMRLSGKKSGY